MAALKKFWIEYLLPGLMSLVFIVALLVGMAFLVSPDWSRKAASHGQVSDTQEPPMSAPVASPYPEMRPEAPAPERPVRPSGPTSSQINTLNALWANCQAATRNNAQGEYPAMQRMSCHDYQVFAQKIGIEANAVAAVREAAPQPKPDRAYRERQVHQECQTCQYLFAEKDRLDERMRRYAHSAQEGERLRNKEREISDRIYELRCSRFSQC